MTTPAAPSNGLMARPPQRVVMPPRWGWSLNLFLPMAYAMGYGSVAAARLK